MDRLNLNTLAIIGGTLGIGVGFGLQQIVGNWVAGLVLLVEQPVRIGDVINVRSLTGTIIKIGGRSTWVRTYDDEVVIIPNSDLTNHQVVNWTANDLKVRITIPVGVGYGSDPEQVRATLLQIMEQNAEVLKLRRRRSSLRGWATVLWISVCGFGLKSFPITITRD